MSTPTIVVRGRAGRVAGVTVDDEAVDLGDLPGRIGPALGELATRHPAATLAWVDDEVVHALGEPASWATLRHHANEVRSVGLLHAHDRWLATLGAADFDSALQLPPPADRAFGSWLLSPCAGVLGAPLLRAAGPPPADLPFPAWCLVLGHRLYLAGAFLWSDPALLTDPTAARSVHSATTVALAVRHAFGRRFLLPWTAAVRGVERRSEAVIAATAAVVRPGDPIAPEPLVWPEPGGAAQPAAPGVPESTSIDVVIPTYGRRELLLDVLDDLARQTLQPTSVVVVEQTGGATPGLPIDAGRYPFRFEHLAIERLGAGNARNVGLGRGTAPWVLMLDDDVRFQPDVVARLLRRAQTSGSAALTAHLVTVRRGPIPAVAEPGEPPALRMWPGFGSGGALVARDLLAQSGGFDRRIDGGFGEDTELGVRLRRAGAMVALASDPPILHLKAPVGGMRAPFPHPWRADPDRPRPSPTMVFARSTFETPAMATGYRIHWWLDGLRRQGLALHPWRRRRAWRSARRWAARLARSEQPARAQAVPPHGEDSRPLDPPEHGR